MPKQGRRSYDKEFKREAIRLVIEEGQSASVVEHNLGIGKSTVSSFLNDGPSNFLCAFKRGN